MSLGTLLRTNAVHEAHGSGRQQRLRLGGCDIDLTTDEELVDLVVGRLSDPSSQALAVGSANLDHLYHFGHHGSLERFLGSGPEGPEWLMLLDGTPLVWQARHRSHRAWPRLAGSDLIEPLLAAAATNGKVVGFLGGAPATHDLLRTRLSERWPTLQTGGYWAPSRTDLTDPDASRALAEDIANAGVELLVVCLGKPRQEIWIEMYGSRCGAKVLLAFGASADFVAGIVPRAPDWMRSSGLEWLFRLSHEPRRLARRYLVQGPVAAARLLDVA